MKIIGLTGGVGSGKSTVVNIMQTQFQCNVLIADDIGRMCMQKGTIAYHKIVLLFGTEIILENGELNRKKISQQVFQNPVLLEQLNGIVHPFVKEEIVTYIERAKKEENVRYIVIESAILYEAGYQSICDEIWYVSVPEKLRRERLKVSRGYTDKKIDEIMKNQMSEQEFLEKCDKVIDNSCGIENLKQQLEILLV